MPSRARIAVALTVAVVLALTAQAAGAEDRRGGSPQATDPRGAIQAGERGPGADAATLAIALAEADRAVADARGKLREARERLALTREYKAQATEVLIEVRSRTDELQQTLDARVRDAYMTGNLTGLALVLEADSLPHLLSRTATAGYAAQRERETLVRLRAARDQIASLHATQLANEREQQAAEAAVAGRLAELLRVRAARAEAKRALDIRAAGLAGATAQARASSRAVASRWAAGPAAAATCRASRRPSSGSSCASLAGTRALTTRPPRRSGWGSCCSATASCTSAGTMPPPTAASSSGRSGPTCATATAPPSAPRRSGRPTAGTDRTTLPQQLRRL